MQNLLMKIAKSKKHTEALKRVSSVSSIFCSLVFIGEIAYFLLDRKPFVALAVAVSAGVGFVLVTLLRAWINAPRPYELRDYYTEAPKAKEGKSFPSRHAYSAFVIATLAWIWHPAVAFGTALLAIAVCLSRVFSGIHFWRDVVCGALIGVVAGVAGMIILNF